MILILAGTFEQALCYAYKAQLPNMRWCYLDNADKLRGTVKPDVVRCGTYFERKDLYDIEVELAYRQANFLTDIDLRLHLK